MRRLLKRAGDSSGMALLITLLVMVILAVLVHRFTFATRVHISAAGYHRDQLQAECLARSGFNVALYILEKDEEPAVDHLGEQWALFQGSQEIDSLTEAEGSFAVKVLDESAKIDLNHLIKADGSPDAFVQSQVERLLEVFDLPRDRLDTLLDWLDPDDDRRLQGAEDADYQVLDSPYSCRNGPLRTLGELRLVLGWQDSWDLSLDDGTTLADYLTVGPTEGRININTAPTVVLQTLDPQIDESLAAEISALREEAPLESTQSLLLASGMTQEIFERIKDHVQTSSSLFHVQSEGVFRRAVTRLYVRVAKSGDGLQPVQWRIE